VVLVGPSWARTCQQLCFRYMIRKTPDVWIDGPSYRGNLADYPIGKVMQQLPTRVRYRRGNSDSQHVAIYWKIGLPKNRNKPWFPITDLEC